MNSKRKAKSLRFSSHSSKVFRQFAYSYDVKVSKSINLGTLTSVKRLAKSPIGFSVSYIDCSAIKWFYRLRHSATEIDNISVVLLVKQLDRPHKSG